MASTYSPSLRLELIGDGDQSGIWGQTTNNNLGYLLEQSVAGVIAITMTDANYTLSNFNGVVDEARNQVLVMGGALTATRNVIAPLVEKTYIVKNSTTGSQSIQIIGSSGLGVTIPNGVTALVYCDGTNFYNALTGSVGNFTVNGNLSVTGTTALTGALSGSTAAFSGAISSVSPTFTGTPTAPTATAGTNTTQIATTAFVQTATGTLGTMSTQNANAVAITGGTITGITDLTVADGGTGSSSFTANSVLLGNGTSALSGNLVAPGTSGNVLTSNGTTWTSASNAAPSILYNQAISADTTYTVSLTASNRPVQIALNIGAIQGGAASIAITFEWGIGSLTNSYNPVNSFVNYVVYPCPSLTTFVTPSSASTLYFRISTSGLSVSGAFASVIQL
jgi:hypothetical protein